MRNVIHALQEFNGYVLLVTCEYHYDCDILIIDKVGTHPIRSDGIILDNVFDPTNFDEDTKQAFTEFVLTHSS